MKKINCIGLSLFFSFAFLSSQAQEANHPFTDEIAAFQKADSANPPPQHAILFVGSSSFRKWTDVQSYFPAYPVINRGFGGSSIPDLIYFADKIIYPYHPKEVLIYAGDNDLAAADSITPAMVVEHFKTLFAMIRGHLPQVSIGYVSIKPSPSRQKLMPKMDEVNSKIKAFLKLQKDAFFVDVYHKMLGSDQLPLPTLFLEDNLHMNQNGYRIWQKEILPFLIK